MSDTRGILDQNAFRLEQLDPNETTLGELVQKRLATVGPTSMLFYEKPLHLVRGEGVWLFDDQGRRYLDMYNNVPSIGHSHPHVTQAVAAQMGTLNTHTRYLHEGIHRYAERLLATLPDSLSRLVLTCTGSESNDLALRLARHWTGKRGVIVSEAAYHGNTAAVTEVSPSSYKKGAPPDSVYVIPIADMLGTSDPAAWFQAHVQRGVEMLDARGYGCAALLVDSIFSSDGIVADPPGFMAPGVTWLQAKGGLLIADEVQPGFGRTGAGMWGFSRHGVTPDIVTMGKPMGNGFPMAGLAARDDLLAALNAEVGYFNTFGGSTVAVAAGMAVLDVLENESLIDNARRQGDTLKAALAALVARFEAIAAVRGAGLFVGLDLATPEGAPDAALTARVINSLKENGVLIGAAGRFGHTLKIRPPLCINNEEIALFVEQLTHALEVTTR
ncbi:MULTISPECIES: aspartate aminotransferase family protein [unclassified Halomonas]|uniref:aspartate aminotransferase family protein n=1 Tax=unclassified Halomonas TaxID=2609666 RepID=UPI002076B100|nr:MULTISPECIES: aspartate aminotransferase family protein [unclassified Halomonas]